MNCWLLPLTEITTAPETFTAGESTENDLEVTDEAIKCFSKAISIEPNKADFYHNRGFAYRKKREFDMAIKDYQNAIQRDPNHFKAYYNRAFCWDKLNEYEQSEADY